MRIIRIHAAHVTSEGSAKSALLPIPPTSTYTYKNVSRIARHNVGLDSNIYYLNVHCVYFYMRYDAKLLVFAEDSELLLTISTCPMLIRAQVMEEL